MARRALVTLFAAMVTGVVAGPLGPLTTSGPTASAATQLAEPYDFDGDGRQDLVAGAPGLKVGSMGWEAGGVVVLPTSEDGLVPEARLLTQALPELGDYVIEGGRFGSGLTSADFDRDGYADLVAWTPVALGAATSTSVLSIVPGSPSGLDLSRLSSRGNPDPDDDLLGLRSTVATGDFTGDGYPDLAVGTQNDYVPVAGDRGASGTVLVFSGGSGGLSRNPVRTLHRQGLGGGHQDWDSGFGATLGAGDLNGDGVTDLVVGSSGANDQHAVYPGSVSVCPGAVGGPAGCTRLAHSLDYVDAAALAVGHVTGSSRPEVVVALPRPAAGAPGSVRILGLKPTGPLALDRTLVLTQASRGVPGVDEPDDAFGSALALADLDRDGRTDLVVGAPGENDGKGRVTIVHGAGAGWRTRGNLTLDQHTRGVPGTAQRGDAFGSALALLDHDGDGRLDLDVGVPGEDGTGLVVALRGKGKGFTTKKAKTFTLGALGVPEPERAGFGAVLGG
ncbi:FG-GAP-like repeat-containing protein [Microlunatus flavus]|uniref:FG-GAP repeat-containing protein n=1 Tax=Microlunatus flavus TaxID=1036181 RepID=A0A1H9HDX8_9ACTN|nr:FG-GAP-like repeat-containing protein [Microlunatus flavus]SEQ60497.1 FG-GAP repeat-containing protein [Microlunatus flavus]